MSSKKQYGGVIHDWFKYPVVNEAVTQAKLDDRYGKNLGFVISGHLKTDPTGRFGRGPIRTSLVVKFSDKQIETLNTVYDLGEPAK